MRLVFPTATPVLHTHPPTLSFSAHQDTTSNNGGGGGGELGGPAVGPPVNQGRPIKNWRVSKEAASLLACQGNKNKAAKGAEAYSVAHCLEVPPPASGDTLGVSVRDRSVWRWVVFFFFFVEMNLLRYLARSWRCWREGAHG